MKNVILLFVVTLFFSAANAQKVYFVYLQSENQQPFYARMGERVYNSNTSGYLILSKLRDSTYNLNIGFQGSQTADLPFSIAVNKKDQGFLVKNSANSSWELFDLQTMALIKPGLSPAVNNNNQVKTEKREGNAFTDLLAKAADDSTIKEKPIIVKAEKKSDEPIKTEIKKEENKIPVKDTINTKPDDTKENIREKNAVRTEEVKVPIKDTTAIKPSISNETTNEKPAEVKTEEPLKKEVKKEEIKPSSNDSISMKSDTIDKNREKEKPLPKTDTIMQQSGIENKSGGKENTEIYKKTTIIRHSESSTTEGFSLTFFDVYPDGKSDTIKILIPAESKNISAPGIKETEKKFLEINSIDTTIKQTTIDEKDTGRLRNESEKLQTLNPTVSKKNICNQLASDDDFFKLRKNMAADNGDDDMIGEAKKIFKVKCFTTQQVKNLSALFLSNEGKYKFFDAAYNYVTDVENYASLQSELTDDYYINRFKAMLH